MWGWGGLSTNFMLFCREREGRQEILNYVAMKYSRDGNVRQGVKGEVIKLCYKNVQGRTLIQLKYIHSQNLKQWVMQDSMIYTEISVLG